MTTYTISGYSRVITYETGEWTGFSTSRLQFIRPDGQDALVYFYPFVGDDSGPAKMVQVIDPHSHAVLLTRAGTPGVTDLHNGFAHVEHLVYALDWAPGKTTYVYALFQPLSGVEHVFAMGGDALPPVGDIAALNDLMAHATRYVTEGPFESGEEVPLAGFQGVIRSQNDRVTALPATPLFWDAGLGQDVLTGGEMSDTLLGGAGNDVLTGGGGADLLMGGTGNDTLTSGGTYGQILGGAGDDQILAGGEGGDMVEGGSGNDRITLGDGLPMGGGYVAYFLVNAGSGQDEVLGGAAGDVIHGNAGHDTLSGLAGDDMMTGGGGDDLMTAGTGNDALAGGTGNDNLVAEDGNDSLAGGLGDDSLSGGTGLDTLAGDDGNDTLDGGRGNDRMTGGLGDDSLTGGLQNDRIEGQDGRDSLSGDDGADTLLGGTGNDTITGGAGADSLSGASGADDFVYLAPTDSPDTGADTITGFQKGVDDIDLSAIDANGAGAGDPVFVLIGAAAFTAAGQLRLVEHVGGTFVQADVDGDALVDLQILVAGVTGMTAADFIL